MRRSNLGLSIVLLAAIASSGMSGGQVPAEPAPPVPTAAVQQLLNQAAAAASTDVAQALEVAERARAAAEHANDAIGAARAVRARGVLLPRLKRNDDALAAWSFFNLGLVTKDEGDFDASRAYFVKAFELRQKLVPDTPLVAGSLSGLAAIEQIRGDLAAARAHFQRALAIVEKWAPESPDHGMTLGNLGQVADLQGDLAGASAYYARALGIFERQNATSIDVARTLDLLGMIAQQQGDLAAARDYLTRAMELAEMQAPGSLDAARSYVNLGLLTFEEGDLERARDFYQRALAITDKVAPKSPGVATALANLGSVAERQGDLASARDYHSRALARREAIAPESLAVASSLHSLGTISRRQSDLKTASTYHQRALTIREKVAPASLDFARSLYEVAALSNARGDVGAAVEQATRAWAIVRAQGAIVTGDEARQAFEAHYQSIGTQVVQFLLALGRTDEAFAILEQGRAQALLSALSARGVARRLAPAELWQRYEVSQATSNRAGTALEAALLKEAQAKSSLESEIAQLSPAAVIAEKRHAVSEQQRKTEEARDDYSRMRVDAEQRWADVARAIRPALPEPIGLEAARQALPVDTMMAAFAVGDEASFLFLIERDKPIRGYPIVASREQLAARVRVVLETTSRHTAARAGMTAVGQQARIDAARNLFAQLFPADSRSLVLGAKRLVLSPDGPLWDLPFAALVTNPHGMPQYLGLRTPLTYTQSLTTFGQTMARASRSGARQGFLIIGNPLYDNALRSTAVTSRPPAVAATTTPATPKRARGGTTALSDDGTIPPPLPFAEVEARRIAALYSAHASTGAQPTEAWFRQRAADAGVIHLATHGFFHSLRALSSGVHLAVPATDPKPGETDNDGALQAWEVFTQLQLGADLVVLSACDSAVGSRGSAEGLVGLTRAFQVAGAASVVASQWKVQDQSTARTMVAFHQSLLKGLSRDVALHLAMRQVSADPVTRDPYFWAPFILVGDPRSMPQRER